MNILKDSLRDSIKYIITRVFIVLIVGFIFLTIFYFVGKKYENKYTFVKNINELVFGYQVHALTYNYSELYAYNENQIWEITVPQGSRYNYYDLTFKDNLRTTFDLAVFHIDQLKVDLRVTTNDSYEQTCTGNYGNGSITFNCGHDVDFPDTFPEDRLVTLSYRVFNVDGTLNDCWETDELKGSVVCPINKNSPINKFRVMVRTNLPNYTELKYKIEVARTIRYFNYDSTEIVNGLSGLENKQDTIIDSITDSDTSFSGNSFQTFINNYTNTIPNNITRVVATPLQTIVNLQSATCSPLSLTIPFLNQTFTLPCMDAIYTQYFGGFYTLYQVIVSGLVTYWCIIGILNTAKSLLDADDDKIEVLDL